MMKKRKDKGLSAHSGHPPGSTEGFSPSGKSAVVNTISYDNDGIEEFSEFQGRSSCRRCVNWINIDVSGDSDTVSRIAEEFSFHPLMTEDILLNDTRVKHELYGENVLIVMKMLYLPSDGDLSGVQSEQISMVLGENYVLTFQERPGDVFASVRKRIRGAVGRVRSKGADYLAYALMDAVVDSYFSILEAIGNRVSSIEETLMNDQYVVKVEDIHLLKRELISLRRAIWPVREMVKSVERDGADHFKQETLVFLRDLYDNVITSIDTVETYGDLISGINDLYLSSISNRMNEVMKVLTLIATLFIPLTFIAGVYGMNFKHIPELDFKYSYPIFWGFIIIIVGSMLLYFKKKKWF